MSYCRFSSDNWKSDVYAYESESGYEIHVAASRHVGDIPKLPDISKVDEFEYLEAYMKHLEAIDNARLVNIGGRYDGMSATFDTPEELHVFMEHLQKEGYHVPSYVFETLKEEFDAGQ